MLREREIMQTLRIGARDVLKGTDGDFANFANFAHVCRRATGDIVDIVDIVALCAPNAGSVVLGVSRMGHDGPGPWGRMERFLGMGRVCRRESKDWRKTRMLTLRYTLVVNIAHFL